MKLLKCFRSDHGSIVTLIGQSESVIDFSMDLPNLVRSYRITACPKTGSGWNLVSLSRDLYDRAAFELPEGVREPVRLSPKIALHSHRELGGYKGVPKNEDLDAEQSRVLRHGYYACVSYVDAQVGKVLDALKRLGLEQNTIVVIWGDHSFALGEANRWTPDRTAKHCSESTCLAQTYE